MATKSLMATAVILVSLTPQAQAQSLPGIAHEGSTVTLAFNFHNDGDDELYSENFTTQLTAASRYAFGTNFGATVTLGYVNEEYDDTYYSERYLLDLNPYYKFGIGTVGVFYAVIAHDEEGIYTDDAQYGVTADLKINGIGVEAYAGVYEEENIYEEDTHGLATSYDVTTDAMIYVAYQRDVDGDNYDDILSIGATYDLSGLIGGVPVSVTGQASRLGDQDDRFGDSDWNQFSIMASYSFGEGATSIFRGLRARDFYYN